MRTNVGWMRKKGGSAHNNLRTHIHINKSTHKHIHTHTCTLANDDLYVQFIQNFFGLYFLLLLLLLSLLFLFSANFSFLVRLLPMFVPIYTLFNGEKKTRQSHIHTVTLLMIMMLMTICFTQ